MGVEDHTATHNHQRRQPPPRLQSNSDMYNVDGSSRPGAFSGGPDLPFGRVEGSLSTSYYSNNDNNNNNNDSRTSKTNEIDPDSSMSSISKRDLIGKSCASTTSHTMEDSSLETSVTPAAIPLDAGHFDSRLPWTGIRRQWTIPIVLMALIAVLTVIIPVAVLVGGKEEQQHSMVRQTSPPLADKPNMTLEELQELVPGMTLGTLQAILSDDNSPQALAYQWVLGDPYDWGGYEDWRKVQRFAMAVLFYSMGGPGWSSHSYTQVDWMRYHIHECDWMKWGKTDLVHICDGEDHFSIWHFPELAYLRGRLPREISYLSHLKFIDLRESDVGKDMTNLFSLLLEDDEDLSKFLPALETLGLKDTRLQGEIPSALGTITTLTKVDLSQNDLTLTIPSELGRLTNLETLDLSLNELTGSIPSELGDLSHLHTFYSQGNLLSLGPVPEEWCSESHPIIVGLTTDWCDSYDQCCASR